MQPKVRLTIKINMTLFPTYTVWTNGPRLDFDSEYFSNQKHAQYLQHDRYDNHDVSSWIVKELAHVLGID